MSSCIEDWVSLFQEAGIDKEVQGRIYSAFYNGYTATQVRPIQGLVFRVSHALSAS